MATTVVESGRASPLLGGGAEVHEADISTDGSGNGSTTVSWEDSFDDSNVVVLVTGTESGTWFVSSAGASQATVEVEGATADGTVTAYVLAAGDR